MANYGMASDKTASGLAIKLLRAGDADNYPLKAQAVAVHYDAYLANGSMWDSSRKRGRCALSPLKSTPTGTERSRVRNSRRHRPLRFRLGAGQVIPGLDEAVSQLSMGMRARVDIPAELAYGERGFPGLVPPNTAISFDIELLEIV